MEKPFYFEDIILTLHKFWSNQGCAILEPYDTEVGAGTLHPATALFALGKNAWNIAYVQPSRRPKDSRYGANPNRLQHYYQYQVILKPSPDNIQDLCLKSIQAIGINPSDHDIKFLEDDWKNPSIGACGLGWELSCDGMEVLQFTYMQQIGGIDFKMIPAELTYGLERLAMYIQSVGHFKDILWNSSGLKYSNLFIESEHEFSKYSLELADISMLIRHFEDYESESMKLIENNLPLPAYHMCLKASHTFNMLDARGVISVTDRASYIARIRNLAEKSCQLWMEKNG